MGNEVSIVVRARETGAGKIFDRLSGSIRKFRQKATSDLNAVTGVYKDATGRWHDASGRFIKGNERAGFSLDKIKAKIREFGPDVLKTIGSIVSSGTALGAVFAGPVVSGIFAAAKALITFGQGAAQLGPLVAFLPSLVASFNLFKGTLMLAGPGMAKALEPITKEFANTDKEIGSVTKAVQEAASKGLPELAQQFVKLNLPNIRSGMVGIAESVNKVATDTGKWVNSAEGILLIKTTTEATDRATEKLAPKVSKVVVALGQLANRAGDRAITGLGNLLGKAADKAAELIDNISREDIDRALNKAKDAAQGFGEKLSAVRDIVQWLGDHKDFLTGLSDGLALTSIAVGAASGNWVAVIAGAVTLILNHFDTFKSKASGIWNAIANDPGVKMIWDAIVRIAKSVKDDLGTAFQMIRPYLQDFGAKLGDLWTKAAPLIAQFFSNPNVVAGIKSIALGIAAITVALIAAAGAMTAFSLSIAGALGGALAWITGKFVNGILSAIQIILTAFGSMASALGNSMASLPGKAGEIGRALQRVGQDALGAAGQVRALQAQLNSLQSKTVTVTINNVVNTIRRETTEVYRISDGNSTKRMQRAGGVTRAAQGGSRWGGVLVGEDGPEIVDIAPGSQVTTAPQTRRKLSSMSGSGTGGGREPLVLEINSSGSDLDNLLVSIIRRAVRVRGGNVQLVFGRGV